MLIKLLIKGVTFCLTMGDVKAQTFFIAADFLRLAEKEGWLPVPWLSCMHHSYLRLQGHMGKKILPLTNPFCLNSITWTANPGLIEFLGSNKQLLPQQWFKQMSEYASSRMRTTLKAAIVQQLFHLICLYWDLKKRSAVKHFCTVPALEATLGCLGFFVRRTLRTLSVISSTCAWTLFKQMSDSGLQYWSIKTAPGKNKLYKKQNLSFLLAWFEQLKVPGLWHTASNCSRTQ